MNTEAPAAIVVVGSARQPQQTRGDAQRTRSPRAWWIGLALTLTLQSSAPSAKLADVERPAAHANPESGLKTWEFGGARTPLVLLHGYGSAPEDWFPFIETIHPAKGGRFVFPEGPEATHPPDGPEGARAWWRLMLDTYVPRGRDLPDMSKAHPDGLVRAAARVRTLVHELEQRMHLTPGDLVIGGFSQGAMVAAEAVLRGDQPVRALVLLSGTPVAEGDWRKAAARRRGLPVFISHGRSDKILPFEAAERFQHELARAGLKVTFFPFDGDHAIPVPVVTALNDFLAHLAPRGRGKPETAPPATTTPGDKRDHVDRGHQELFAH